MTTSREAHDAHHIGVYVQLLGHGASATDGLKGVGEGAEAGVGHDTI